jgi:hypothetical protein
MRTMIMAFALATLGACARANEGERDWRTAPIESACTALATQRWTPLSGVYFTVEASTAGPTCEHAVATITLRYADRQVLYAEAFPASQVMTLAAAREAIAMEAALAEWIDPSAGTMQTTGALPDWPADAQAPVGGEYPFYVEPGWDRRAYMQARSANIPMFCFVHGMESSACLVARHGRFERIGVQTFPG